MRRKCVFLFVAVLATYSCSKNQIEPKSNPQSNSLKSIQFPSMTQSFNATSYTQSKVINLDGVHDITISGKAITGGSVPAITLSNCYNVHITQNSLTNSTEVGIHLYHCYNITVDYNYIANVSTGVYVDHPTGGGTVVDNNQMLNMQGPFPRGQFVQFNNVKGAGNEIKYNKLQNILGQSSSQEAINLYMSNGTPSSPIQVVGNWIKGGGPNSASGGIQLGDTGGSYQVASGNIMVDPGQMGLSISGGDHISFINNTVYAKAQYFTNVGVVVWGQAGSKVTNATVSGNKINFKNSANSQNDNWIASGNPTPAGWGNNSWGANISSAILPSNLISSSAATSPLQASSSGTVSNTQQASTGTTSAPIVMTGKNNVTIKGLTISGGSSPCIKLANCTNVYITLCNLKNSTNVGIELDNCTNVTIEKNNIFNVAAGIVAKNCPSGGISIYSNQMLNMQGSVSGGAFVQFVKVNGSNNNISYNKLQNILGSSDSQNEIDLVSSNGTSANPITIDGNWIRGGGPNSSGGGICLGNNGGSYQLATNNVLADPGQFGLAIIGGNHMSLTNNTVYGKQQSFTNVGIFVWGQNGAAVSSSVISGNKVNFTNKSNNKNPNWLADGQSIPSGWSTNDWESNIDESVLPTSIVSI
ncbi:right-handed parallel beta-helix repeat-containing protein [Mucilaginibacter sp. L3T2-6]|uniref:right-handed parallel beta-helix repeat-containing protein n=1 Tax=Mucilaginibacter sp. L3T2-6 TaxID=3062491 RepID=UPI002675A7FF|nr:right-handed parallel beta-helix repeat-containing protein [Mucilaginibacter sp. L3T2-6]MDO3643694.1 right-handed parallel beta-helix repeat-containing protein [Mucilaginibacter sp. L3T2-6]MDV6216058.1 right-handed parallel beta-helix repeat-containing protein [Mucilaginibacter sp. L3T2-6]